MKLVSFTAVWVIEYYDQTEKKEDSCKKFLTAVLQYRQL